MDTRSWILWLHLSGFVGILFPGVGNIVAPLIIWNMKKQEIPAVNAIGKDVLNFQITTTLAIMIASILSLACVGAFILPIIGIAWVVLMIVAAIKASNGENYHYPLTIKFVK